MALFPDPRSGRGAHGVRPPDEVVGERVAQRLREIAAASAAPEDALEPALRALLGGCGASAGAVCLFDARTEVLRLAAEVGLSDEGCRQLRSVRRGGIGSWDMPLHSLLNRRAYLIESAARNRYVPPLVEPARQVRTLACVPLFAGQAPIASLLLIAMIPQTISERDIRLLEPALRELTRMIEAVRRRAAGFPSGPAPAAPPAGPEKDPPPNMTAGAPSDPEEGTATVAAPTEAAEAARAVVAQETEAARAELDRLRTELERLARDEREARDEAERLRSELAAALAERERLLGTLPSSAELEAARTELEAIRREREEARHAAQRLAAERDALLARLAKLEHRLSEEQALREHEAAERCGERAAAAAERERLEAALTAAEGAAERARTEAVRLTTELQGVAEAAHAAHTELAATRTEREEARHAAQRLAAERDALLARLAELEHRLSEEQALREHEAAERCGERAAAAAERERLEALLADAEASAAAARAELEALRTATAAVRPTPEAQAEEQAPSAIPHGTGPSPGMPLTERESPSPGTPPVIAAPVDPVAPQPSGAPPTTRTILILDAPPAWDGVAVNGHAVRVLAATEALEAPAPHAETILVNLAADAALESIVRLRSRGGPLVRGFVGAPGAPGVLPLGVVELASRPVDPPALLQALGRIAASGTRVVIVGADVDVFIGVRQALGRAGMSVSMAWNAKQAMDLLAMVKPHVLIVDLDLPQRDGYAIVARAAAWIPTPALVILPGREPPEPRFAALLADPALAERLVPRERLLDEPTPAEPSPASPPRQPMRRPGR